MVPGIPKPNQKQVRVRVSEECLRLATKTSEMPFLGALGALCQADPDNTEIDQRIIKTIGDAIRLLREAALLALEAGVR